MNYPEIVLNGLVMLVLEPSTPENTRTYKIKNEDIGTLTKVLRNNEIKYAIKPFRS